MSQIKNKNWIKKGNKIIYLAENLNTIEKIEFHPPIPLKGGKKYRITIEEDYEPELCNPSS